MSVGNAVKTTLIVVAILTLIKLAIMRFGGPLAPIGAAMPGGM